MSWIDYQGRRLWVGQHPKGGLLVYDPSSESARNNENVSLYLVAEDRIGTFRREIIREHVKQHTPDKDEVRSAVEAYLQFLDKPRRVAEQAAKEGAEAKRSALEARHRAFLEKGGQQYSGVRIRPNSSPQRITHCWSCKRHLDSSIDLECVACNWILCDCGACGCGWSPS
jgi:uncharacterized small protein (DUF1192 family)